MPAQDDLARSMAGAIRGPGRLMRLPGATHGSPIFFEHRLEHPYARRDDQLLQLGLGIDEDVNHRPVARRRGCRLATTRDCVRLLLQGGSFAGRLSPRFSHRSYSTTSEGAAASNFNSYWDIPIRVRPSISRSGDATSNSSRSCSVFVLSTRRQLRRACPRCGLLTTTESSS